MSHREFQDEDGRAWEVWDVQPSHVATTTHAGMSHVEATNLEPHARRARFDIPVELRGGWLAFKSDGESRRLAPIPSSWVGLPDQDLALLVRTAKPIAKVTHRL